MSDLQNKNNLSIATPIPTTAAQKPGPFSVNAQLASPELQKAQEAIPEGQKFITPSKSPPINAKRGFLAALSIIFFPLTFSAFAVWKSTVELAANAYDIVKAFFTKKPTGRTLFHDPQSHNFYNQVRSVSVGLLKASLYGFSFMAQAADQTIGNVEKSLGEKPPINSSEPVFMNPQNQQHIEAVAKSNNLTTPGPDPIPLTANALGSQSQNISNTANAGGGGPASSGSSNSGNNKKKKGRII
ncbi:MAG: hypothetical protein SFV53_01615 [Rickettsiales bacterium]|nr:hypothetical protein [Rickettsiales bacterium]